jgi:hypothetical protein
VQVTLSFAMADFWTWPDTVTWLQRSPVDLLINEVFKHFDTALVRSLELPQPGSASAPPTAPSTSFSLTRRTALAERPALNRYAGDKPALEYDASYPLPPVCGTYPGPLARAAPGIPLRPLKDPGGNPMPPDPDDPQLGRHGHSEGAAELIELLGLTDDELCQTLDVEPLMLLSGQLEHRAELPILLDLLAEARERAPAAVLRRWVRASGSRGRPIDMLMGRDFAAFEDALSELAERGFVLRRGGS